MKSVISINLVVQFGIFGNYTKITYEIRHFDKFGSIIWYGNNSVNSTDIAYYLLSKRSQPISFSLDEPSPISSLHFSSRYTLHYARR